MSPEEWAEKIDALIQEAENDLMSSDGNWCVTHDDGSGKLSLQKYRDGIKVNGEFVTIAYL